METNHVHNRPIVAEVQNFSSRQELIASKDEIHTTRIEENEETSIGTSFHIGTSETVQQNFDQHIVIVSTETLPSRDAPERRNQPVPNNRATKNKTMRTLKDFKDIVTPEEIEVEMAKYNPNMVRTFVNVEQSEARKKNTFASRMCRAKVRIAKRKMEEYFKSKSCE